ncbi:unnamed protein product [Amoebophrya sp. A25]|nr:unnamed protein product [Amoebophrya sp. A25]|eukprot:GSA25T00005016001.1
MPLVVSRTTRGYRLGGRICHLINELLAVLLLVPLLVTHINTTTSCVSAVKLLVLPPLSEGAEAAAFGGHEAREFSKWLDDEDNIPARDIPILEHPIKLKEDGFWGNLCKGISSASISGSSTSSSSTRKGGTIAGSIGSSLSAGGGLIVGQQPLPVTALPDTMLPASYWHKVCKHVLKKQQGNKHVVGWTSAVSLTQGGSSRGEMDETLA